MKITKLITGIISIVLTFLILFQSCAATVGDAMANEGGTSGFSGLLVAILMLIAGIVSVATHKSRSGNTFCIVFYVLAGLIGLTMSGIFTDLKIWGGLCLVFAAILLLYNLRSKKKPAEPDGDGEHE